MVFTQLRPGWLLPGQLPALIVADVERTNPPPAFKPGAGGCAA
jgi:hypothetical protein